MNEKPQKLIKNAAKCLKCNQVVESKYRHDYVACKCGNIAVDGGLSYVRRCSNGDFEDLSEWSDE